MGLGRGIKELWLAGSEGMNSQAEEGVEEGRDEGTDRERRKVWAGAKEEDVRAVVEGLGRLM